VTLTPHPDLPLVATMRLLDETAAADLCHRVLAETPWNDGSYLAGGRRFQLPRLQTWFSDPGVAYRYADNLLNSHPWTPILLDLKQQVEALCNTTFNAVLVNLYRDGQDAVGWHADDEPDLGPAPIIASLSLGAVRRFSLRPKTDPSAAPLSIPLPAGTLLLMSPPLQRDWEHAVLAEADVTEPRINLTFRRVLAPA
jgi:alkylated DNA repair dioxygenase AlkB